MSISIANVDTLANAQAAASATTTAGSDDLGKDAFLNLLVTQMQYQDPLNPQANEEFVAQLAQFSSLEQLMDVNGGLNTLYMATASMNNAAMTQLIGQDAKALGDGFHYEGSGDATLHYDADATVQDAELTIRNEDGDIVFSGTVGQLEQGEGTVSWDGTDHDGQPMEEGVYTFELTGLDSNGDDVSVTTYVVGTIDGMAFEGGATVPTIDGVEIDLGDILALGAAATDGSEDAEEGTE